MADRAEKGREGWKLAAEAAFLVALAAGIVGSRLAYRAEAPLMSKDGPLYITSLAMGPDYCVPMPGNIGYVVLGRVAQGVAPEPVDAFAVVNALLTAVGTVYLYGLGVRRLGRLLAGATALALACNPMVWWHGATINSYLVWLAVLPAVAYHGSRWIRERRTAQLLACSAAFGVGTILRQDLLAFAGPLWLGCVALGRPSWRQAIAAAGVVAACCVCWFAGTSAVLGGAEVYLARVQAKHEAHMEGFSPVHKGLFEGLVRNGSKYALFLLWAAVLVLPAAVVGVISALRRLGAADKGTRGTSIPKETGREWRPFLLAALWVGPSWAFSFGVFAGNAGLIFPFLPLVYLAAAWGLRRLLRGEGPAWPVAAMAVLALAGLVQFVGTPILPETNQRNVVLNVTLLRYSGPGLRARLDRNLDDYGIDPSLGSVLRQLRAPEAVPGRLARLGS